MNDKVVLITGGNTGIGKETAIGLAQMGAEVIIACRNMDKATQAVSEIQKASSNQNISALQLDLASLDSVRAFTDAFKAKHDKIDILVNNAGVLAAGFDTTKDGFEKQIGVNHLGHFLLTLELLDCLKKSEEARVVVVASDAHYGGNIKFETFQAPPAKFKLMEVYGQSKLANILFSKELSRRYPFIASNSLHPGVVRTKIANKASSWVLSIIWTLMGPIMRSPKKGAQTSIFLASAPDLKGVSGNYYDENQKLKKPSSQALDDTLAQALWEKSLEWTQPRIPQF